jgi:hypothetical protein
VKEENKKKLTSFERECTEKAKNMTSGKGNLSISMLPGKPKHRCIYVFENIRCNREPAGENKYCDEHINPHCLGTILPLGRQCKNKDNDQKEIYHKQCKKEVEEHKEIERSNNEALKAALNFNPSQLIKPGKPFTLNAMMLLFA